MKFLLYLKRKGVITAEQLVTAIEVQHANVTAIGQLAIEEDILSARNVFKVLRCQSDLPNERFGDVAIELGLMSRDGLERLLAIQENRKPPLMDILIKQGVLTPSQCEQELAAYRHDMEQRNVVVTRRIADSLSKSPITTPAPADSAILRDAPL